MWAAEFIAAQWYISDTEYYTPAVAWCKKKGCNLAISKAQFYDAMIQVSWPTELARVDRSMNGLPAYCRRKRCALV